MSAIEALCDLCAHRHAWGTRCADHQWTDFCPYNGTSCLPRDERERRVKELSSMLEHERLTCDACGKGLGLTWAKRVAKAGNVDLCVRCSERFDSGELHEVTKRHRFESGAVRSSDTNHVRYDLMSPIALRRKAETCAEGAAKYGVRNWEKGIPASNLINHALAHIFKYLAGDRSEDHLAHAGWNLDAVQHFEETRPELIDIPSRSVDGAG